jgi:hypothetical protein
MRCSSLERGDVYAMSLIALHKIKRVPLPGIEAKVSLSCMDSHMLPLC